MLRTAFAAAMDDLGYSSGPLATVESLTVESVCSAPYAALNLELVGEGMKRRVTIGGDLHYRGVAQSGSASALGAEGRGFKSLRPDQ